ncbi:hypothetical protein A7U60_g3379 [Sanghuangporus baumii]|uniref:Uncharacterized protein n=1 Tax=Sanghuangporus baumii TaxID=108892 RepID=A0A9Q5N9X2_SANBA|nr:hypothetical protein A7U60_g3379 [Sanghuangporus baumii]
MQVARDRTCLMSLPNETFMEIVELLRADSEEKFGRKKMDQLVKQLSSISRGFRRAVLGIPAFWTTIENNYCLREGFEERIARSRNRPLAVHIHLTPKNVDDVMSPIFSLKNRWRELRANLHGDVVLPLMNRASSKEIFPRVEFVHLAFNTDKDWHMERFWQAWEFPKATIVELDTSRLPPAGRLPEMTTFNLRTFYYRERIIGSYVAELAALLSTAPHLDSFTLQLAFCRELEDDLVTAELPSITSFSLSNFEKRVKNQWPLISGTEPLCQILLSLRMPNLKYFRLTLYVQDRRELEEWLESVAAVAEELRSVTSLSMISELVFESDTLIELLAPFSNIRKLELDVPDLRESLRGLESSLNLARLCSVVLCGQSIERDWDWPADMWKFSKNMTDPNVSVS